MAVAMQTDARHLSRPVETRADLLEQLAHERLVGRPQIRRDEVVLENEPGGLLAERAHVQSRAVLESVQRADGVNAADEAAHPLERVAILELGSAPALTWVQSEREAAVL